MSLGQARDEGPLVIKGLRIESNEGQNYDEDE